jgi:hypothetical protein
MSRKPSTLTPTTAPSAVSRERLIALLAAVAVAIVIAAIFPLSQGMLPFQIRVFAERGQPFWGPIIGAVGSLLVALIVIGVALLVTWRRTPPDMLARAPSLPIARIETAGLTLYAIAGQAGGYFLGRAIGRYPISLHMPGALYGLNGPYTPREALVWAVYNFLIYAVAPYLYFRWRGYSNERLNLTSVNLRADILLIVVILVVESAIELTTVSAAILSLDARQLLLGAPLAFALNLVGTVLPVMIFIYAILLPRYLRLTGGSVVATVILGGLTYAALHVFESWADYTSLTNGLLSVIFVTLQYFGPGMVKSVLTLRTGNAWVHAWAYHVFEPHVLIDTPTIVQIFKI